MADGISEDVGKAIYIAEFLHRELEDRDMINRQFSYKMIHYTTMYRYQIPIYLVGWDIFCRVYILKLKTTNFIINT